MGVSDGHERWPRAGYRKIGRKKAQKAQKMEPLIEHRRATGSDGFMQRLKRGNNRERRMVQCFEGAFQSEGW